MIEQGGSEALNYAFVAVVGGKTEVWTMGMHAPGLRDLVMNRADVGPDGLEIIEMIRYLCQSDRPVEELHWLADPNVLSFQVRAEDSRGLEGSPMHSPFGRLKLVGTRVFAESN